MARCFPRPRDMPIWRRSSHNTAHSCTRLRGSLLARPLLPTQPDLAAHTPSSPRHKARSLPDNKQCAHQAAQVPANSVHTNGLNGNHTHMHCDLVGVSSVTTTTLITSEGTSSQSVTSFNNHNSQTVAQPSPSLILGGSLPRVLILHTGGTLGMDPQVDSGSSSIPEGPDRSSSRGLRPSTMLANVLGVVPELKQISNVDLQVVCNKDSSRVGPADWIQVARLLHEKRSMYDAFMIIHGTDTMAYTASALSLMLQNFGKPVVLTGSQLPLTAPRTDARQNLLDAIQCATAAHWPPHVRLKEVAVCFGGRLMRGNRTRKVHSMLYQAFDSPGYPYLAQLGIDVAWNNRVLLRPSDTYSPRFSLDARVMRIPVVPGLDPRLAYGDLVGRGIRGVVLELYGVGNLPDLPEMGWLPWIEEQMKAGLQVIPISQCAAGPLHQEMYAAGGALSAITGRNQPLPPPGTGPGGAIVSVDGSGAGGGGGMTPECAVVKLMLTLANPELSVGEALAGEF